MIEKRVISKENLDDIKEIINTRFKEDKTKQETRKNILSDLEFHYNNQNTKK